MFQMSQKADLPLKSASLDEFFHVARAKVEGVR